MNTTWLTVGLGLVFLVVLVAPFVSKKIEHNLEPFRFVMGVIAATVSSIWSLKLVKEAAVEPIKITAIYWGIGCV